MFGFTNWKERAATLRKHMEDQHERLMDSMKDVSALRAAVIEANIRTVAANEKLNDHYAAQAEFVRTVDERHRSEIQALHNQMLSLKIAQATNDFRTVSHNIGVNLGAAQMNDTQASLELPDDGPPPETPEPMLADAGAFDEHFETGGEA